MPARTRERHHFAKLDAQAVAVMRRRYAAGTVTQEQLAAEYGVAHGTVWAALCGRTWGTDGAVPPKPRTTSHCPLGHRYSDANTRWSRHRNPARNGTWRKQCCTCYGTKPRTKEEA